ncbi:MAG: hypothetical protein MZV63_56630 [Marinilabiliales bacterium]|nr:hypothetical protein [Marinilabiliales bacterium]
MQRQRSTVGRAARRGTRARRCSSRTGSRGSSGHAVFACDLAETACAGDQRRQQPGLPRPAAARRPARAARAAGTCRSGSRSGRPARSAVEARQRRRLHPDRVAPASPSVASIAVAIEHQRRNASAERRRRRRWTIRPEDRRRADESRAPCRRARARRAAASAWTTGGRSVHCTMQYAQRKGPSDRTPLVQCAFCILHSRRAAMRIVPQRDAAGPSAPSAATPPAR